MWSGCFHFIVTAFVLRYLKVQLYDPKVNKKRVVWKNVFTLTLIDSFLDAKTNTWNNVLYF